MYSHATAIGKSGYTNSARLITMKPVINPKLQILKDRLKQRHHGFLIEMLRSLSDSYF